MKNTETRALLKEVKKKYSRLQGIVNRSLAKFAKRDGELEMFLFHTLLGEAVRSKIARHVFDHALIKYTQHESKKLPLRTMVLAEEIRIFKMLKDENFNKYLKSEFSLSLDVSRNGGGHVVIGFKE